MFTEISTITIPGSTRSESSLSEDAFAVCPSALILMDGATVVNGDENHFAANASDACWLAHRGCSLLMERFDKISMARQGEGSILAAITEALEILEGKYRSCTERDTTSLTPADVPTSSLSFAIVSGTSLFAGQLGDSPLSIKMRDGRLISLRGDEDLISLDEANKVKMRRLIDSGMTIEQAHKAMLPEFSKNRELHCNNGEAGSYRIFCFVGKEQALPNVVSLELEDVESICLYSDGYAEIMSFESYITEERLHDLTVEDASKVVSDLMAHQDQDPNCQAVMRFKKRDDITVISARINSILQ